MTEHQGWALALFDILALVVALVAASIKQR